MAKKVKKKRSYSLGGIEIALSGIGLLSSIYTAQKAASDQKTANKLADQQEKQQVLENDSNFLKTYNTSGSNSPYYRKGGFKLNARTKGNISKFKPVRGNVVEVVGPSHEQGGVDINGANVEGKELIKPTANGMKILSDDKATFGYSPAERVKRGSSFEKEFAIQEASKTSKSTSRRYGSGGEDEYIPNVEDFDKALAERTTDLGVKPYAGVPSMIPSLIDNASSLITTLATPKPKAPALIPSVKLNSDIDVNPQLNAIKSSERNNINFINRNISDSNVATALGISAGNQSTRAGNQVRSGEINAENAIKNKEALANVQPNAINARSINNFSDTVLNRSLDMNEAINENISNLSRDLIDKDNKKRQTIQDNDRLGLELAKDTKGVLANPILSSSVYDEYIRSNRIDLTKLHPDTAAAIERKRLQIANYGG